MFVRANAANKDPKAKEFDDQNRTDEISKKLEAEKRKKEEAEQKYKRFSQPENYTGLIKAYVIQANKVKAVVTGVKFDLLIFTVIGIATLMVGVQTYPELAKQTWVEVVDYIVLAVFFGEVALKVVAEAMAPWRFWTGLDWKWNNFDFAICIACIPGVFGKNAAILRLLRLFRLMKLLKKVPQLQVIIMGMVMGFQSIIYILLLLFLVFYLYAILGILLFRDNDPWHWHNLLHAMITLFRMSTMEDWTDVMYINIYGCERFQGYFGGYTTVRQYFYTGNFSDPHHMQIVTAEWLEEKNHSITDASGPDVVWCKYPSAKGEPDEEGQVPIPVIAVLYYTSFILICGLVMMSLFVGAVTMGMTESMELQKKELEMRAEDRRKEEEALERQLEQEDMAEVMRRVAEAEADMKQNNHALTPEEQKKLEAKQTKGGLSIADLPLAAQRQLLAKLEEDKKKAEHLREELIAVWDGLDLANILQGEEVVATTPIGIRYLAVSKKAKQLVNLPLFQNTVTTCIVLASIFVGVGTYESPITESYEILPDGTRNTLPCESCTDKIMPYAIDGTWGIIGDVFLLEIIVKIVAEDFRPWRFFYSGWNSFDFIVQAASYSGGSLVRVLRLLRILRILKLLRAFPALQVIVVALVKGIASIGYIALILILFFYVAAIMAVATFKDNDPMHFGTLDRAFLSLFRAVTFEDWTDLMYTNMFGCAQYVGYIGDNCNKPGGDRQTWSFFFFFFTSVIGALVLLTLFIGVITTSMDEAQIENKKKNQQEVDIKKTIKAGNITTEEVDVCKKIFTAMDVDGGGTLCKEELQRGLKKIDPTLELDDQELDKMLGLLDVGTEGVEESSGDGEIDIAEFVKFMAQMKIKRNHDPAPASIGINEPEEDDPSKAEGASKTAAESSSCAVAVEDKLDVDVSENTASTDLSKAKQPAIGTGTAELEVSGESSVESVPI